MAFEHEIKLPVKDLDAVRRCLAACGARCDRPLAFEDNQVFDDEVGRLRGAGSLLRLRRTGGEALLTFKGPASFSNGVKTRVELETAVADDEVLGAILAALGLRPVRRYQKRREVWRAGEVTVALDETPMGAFVELEGPPAALPVAAARLELDPGEAVAGTYLDLWGAFRATHPEAPSDMVFTDHPR